MGVRIYSLNINKEVFISWEEIYIYPLFILYYNI